MKMFAIKFDIQKFDDVINFSMWQIKMNAILTQSGLKKHYSRGKKASRHKERNLAGIG